MLLTIFPGFHKGFKGQNARFDEIFYFSQKKFNKVVPYRTVLTKSCFLLILDTSKGCIADSFPINSFPKSSHMVLLVTIRYFQTAN